MRSGRRKGVRLHTGTYDTEIQTVRVYVPGYLYLRMDHLSKHPMEYPVM
jgi:hypothetical protein